MTSLLKTSAHLCFALALSGCTNIVEKTESATSEKPQLSHLPQQPIYGTQNDYASQAIYFLVTDRFVDGDVSNNHEKQGGDFPTFDVKLVGENGEQANVGYLGGDFQGVLNNGQYIKDMGFT
ncbi:MAG: cyclomaltodextrin glucanotransferase, partial [Colwellia sp.]|nr:cyclomaltodextrin glucanotransferase [Colwellia sp.]